MKRRGFSLLEVVVALTIMAAVFTVVFRGLSVSLDTVRRVDDSNRRLELVRSKLAEIDLCPSIRPGDHAEGAFEDGTRWSADTSNFIPATEINRNSIVRIQLKVNWNGRNGNQVREITTYRFMPSQLTPAPPLEDQLRDLR